MFIHEAIKNAIEKDVYITRLSIDGTQPFHATRIRPTNSYANCIVYTFDSNGKEVHRCKNWNPTAEDLMADDWILTDK